MMWRKLYQKSKKSKTSSTQEIIGENDRNDERSIK